MPLIRKSKKAAGQKENQGTKIMGDNPENCPVCMTAFNDTVQRPRNLPCGHTFCTQCINRLEKQDQVTCPTCRVRHALPEAGQFPISYTLEAFIKSRKDTVVAFASPADGTGKAVGEAETPNQKRGAGLSKSMHALLQEQEAKVVAVITACQEVQSQLERYETTLTGWHDQQQQFQDKFQAITDGIRRCKELVQQEKSKTAQKKNQVHQREQQLHCVLETLKKVDTDHQAGVMVVDVIRCTDDAQQRVEQCREMFPDMQTVTTARKMMAASNASLEALKPILVALEPASVTAGDAVSEVTLPADPTSTIMDRLQALHTPTMKAPQSLQAEGLLTMTQPARSLLQAGLVFAAHKTEDHTRHARIRLEDNRMYLHSLRDQTLPPGAAILQVDEVVPACLPCLVFLDLEWPGTAPRRVVIRLSPDTPLGQQFLLMCTGQRGPCYRNTRMLWVGWEGQPGEWVWGGDYENKGGKGGAPLLPHLDKGEYQRSSRAGAVYRVCRGGDKTDWNAMFGIRTKDRQDGGVAMGVFGEVVEGLETVAAAAQHSSIEEVVVVDCGVVL